MEEIFYASATEMIDAMKNKRLSAYEVMKAHLTRIKQVNSSINALVQRFSDEALLKEAAKADDALKKGLELGRLHGLPVTIKDGHLVKGLVSCLGCTALKDKIAIEDSTVVSRLKNEGAIIMGITNIPELFASYETDNLVYGRTNNPYDFNRTSGGSSGGCSALIASGCSPLSIGSDAVGSIRWPAHCTGIAAHKPTLGSVPVTGGPLGNAKGMSAYFSTSGPLARTVNDLIMALEVISGPDGLDPHIYPIPFKDPSSVDISSLKVAYFFEDGLSDITKDTIDNIHYLVDALKPIVKETKHIELNFLKEAYNLAWECYYLGGDGGMGTKNKLALLGAKNFSPLLKQYLQQAKKNKLTVAEFRDFLKKADLFRIKMLQAFKEYDIIISPVASTPAKFHGKTHEENKDMTHCMVHSITGWPVTVIRIGTSKEGLPLGVQIAAKAWQDHVSLALGKKVESLLGGWQRSHFFN